MNRVWKCAAMIAMSAAVTAAADSHPPAGKRYCIIDLSPGPNAKKYSITWRDSGPASSVWQDVYKTTKLVLRRIEPGTFIMGENQKDESYRVTLTKPYYIGVFEVTQKQYALVTGNDPSKYKGKMRPVTDISVEQLRGSCVEYDWPTSRKTAPNSFMGRIRARTGLDGFELPTEAQWEYACRAGTTTLRYDGSDIHDLDNLMNLGRVVYNQRARGWEEPEPEFKKHKPDNKGGYKDFHTLVGLYKPNAWGLYDMYGNAWELCVSRKYDTFGVNPLGRMTGHADRRAMCGGSWMQGSWRQTVTSVGRSWEPPGHIFVNGDTGFRLVLNVDEEESVGRTVVQPVPNVNGQAVRSPSAVAASGGPRSVAAADGTKPVPPVVVMSENLVRNGSFEENSVKDGSYDTSTTITGWSKSGAVGLIRKNTSLSYTHRNDATTRCFINKGASISQTINVPKRMNYLVSLNKANWNYSGRNRLHIRLGSGHVMIDDTVIISDLSGGGGGGRTKSAIVELSPGLHTLKISCTKGWGMSVDDVKVIRAP